jgi:hypothetical protein
VVRSPVEEYLTWVGAVQGEIVRAGDDLQKHVAPLAHSSRVLEDDDWVARANTLATALAAAGKPIREREDVPTPAQPLHAVMVGVVADFETAANAFQRGLSEENGLFLNLGAERLTSATKKIEEAVPVALEAARQGTVTGSPLAAYFDCADAFQTANVERARACIHGDGTVATEATIGLIALSADLRELGEVAVNRWGASQNPLAALRGRATNHFPLEDAPTGPAVINGDAASISFVSGKSRRMKQVGGLWKIDYASLDERPTPARAQAGIARLGTFRRGIRGIISGVSGGAYSDSKQAATALGELQKQMEAVARADE